MVGLLAAFRAAVIVLLAVRAARPARWRFRSPRSSRSAAIIALFAGDPMLDAYSSHADERPSEQRNCARDADTSIEGYDFEPQALLRTVTPGDGTKAALAGSPALGRRARCRTRSPSSSPICSPPRSCCRADRLAAARGRAGGGTLAQAIARRGLRQAGGHRAGARAASQHADHRPRRDARLAGCRELIELRTLKRVVAVPFALVGDRLRVAVADPADIHGIDELRVASRTRWTSPSRAARTSSTELERVARQTEVLETQSAIDELEVEARGRGRPRGRRRRLGRAARPARQLDHHAGGVRRRLATSTSSHRRTRSSVRDARRRRPLGAAADPEADGVGRHDATQGALPSSTSPSGASRRTGASR